MTKPMTVKKLIAILSKLPPDMKVATQRYSEFRYMRPDDVSKDFAFDNGGYLSRVYRTEDRVKANEVVFFEGN